MKRKNVLVGVLLLFVVGMYSCKATDCGCPRFEAEMNAEAR